MEEKDYSNREIDAMFTALQNSLDRIENKILPEIIGHVKTTNGKVASIQRFKERTIGGVIVISIVVLPLLSWGLYQIANLDERIRTGISIELEKYEVRITN